MNYHHKLARRLEKYDTATLFSLLWTLEMFLQDEKRVRTFCLAPEQRSDILIEEGGRSNRAGDSDIHPFISEETGCSLSNATKKKKHEPLKKERRKTI